MAVHGALRHPGRCGNVTHRHLDVGPGGELQDGHVDQPSSSVVAQVGELCGQLGARVTVGVGKQAREDPGDLVEGQSPPLPQQADETQRLDVVLAVAEAVDGEALRWGDEAQLAVVVDGAGRRLRCE